MIGHGSQVLGLSFSPDGKLLASCSADKTVRLWDLQKKSQLRTVSTQPATVYSVAFSPNGKFLATAGADKTVRLFDVPNCTWDTVNLGGPLVSDRLVSIPPRQLILHRNSYSTMLGLE